MATQTSKISPLVTALCIDTDAMHRLGSVLRHLAVGLVDQNVQLSLLSSDPRIRELSLGPIQSLYHKPLRWPAKGKRLREVIDLLSQRPPTIAHALSRGTYPLAMAVADAFDAQVVLHVTSLNDCREVAGIDAARIARIIVTSTPLLEAIAEQLDFPAESVVLVRPGVLAQNEVSCFSNAYDQATLMCTADLRKGAGVDALIEAVRMLHEKHHKLMLFLLGEGPYEDQLRRRTRAAGLSSEVTFAHPLTNITSALKSGDIYVVPAPDQELTVGTLQAMAIGMAVVSGVNSGCDHLRHGETAILCNECTPQQLASAIGDLLSNRDAARRLAAKAQSFVKANHSMSSMGEATAAIYRDLALQRATIPLSGRTA